MVAMARWADSAEQAVAISGSEKRDVLGLHRPGTRTRRLQRFGRKFDPVLGTDARE